MYLTKVCHTNIYPTAFLWIWLYYLHYCNVYTAFHYHLEYLTLSHCITPTHSKSLDLFCLLPVPVLFRIWIASIFACLWSPFLRDSWHISLLRFSVSIFRSNWMSLFIPGNTNYDSQHFIMKSLNYINVKDLVHPQNWTQWVHTDLVICLFYL